MFIWNSLKRPIRSVTIAKDENSEGSDGFAEHYDENDNVMNDSDKRIKLGSSPTQEISPCSNPRKNVLSYDYIPGNVLTRTLTESTIIIEDDNSVDIEDSISSHDYSGTAEGKNYKIKPIFIIYFSIFVYYFFILIFEYFTSYFFP